MSSNYEREIAAQNLEWFAKIKEGDRRVIEQLYNRIIEAEKFVRRLIVSFSVEDVDYVNKENDDIVDWLKNNDEQGFLEIVKKEYIPTLDDDNDL